MFAGTDIGLRDNNEDNFTVCPDLTRNEWIVPADHQQAIPLGERGCVMVVADGMGGQNAGEVASGIAIATVQDMFAPASLPANVLETSGSVKSYLKKVISEADIRVKKHTDEHPETEGMGSTIVIAWLINRTLYVAWLGDSRAYLVNAAKGIGRLSKDHSYVQQLVDAGALTDEAAMTDPNSNVITRSLGDTSQKAKADVMEYSVVDGDIVLLCSDGLCGVCKDEVIGGIVEEGADNLLTCKDRLTETVLEAGGSDNITIALMQIHTDDSEDVKDNLHELMSSHMFNLRTLFIVLFALVLLGCLIFAGYSIFVTKETVEEVDSSTNIMSSNSDSLRSDSDSLQPLSNSYNIKIKLGQVETTVVKDSTKHDVQNMNSSFENGPGTVDSSTIK